MWVIWKFGEYNCLGGAVTSTYVFKGKSLVANSNLSNSRNITDVKQVVIQSTKNVKVNLFEIGKT